MKKIFQFTLLLPLFFCVNSINAQWTDVSLPSGWSLDKGSFIDDLHGYVTSANYNMLFRTTNGGAAWDSVNIPAGAVDVDFISIDTGFVLVNIFSNFSLATTYNRGNSWTTDTLPAGDYYQLIRFTNASTGYATSTFGNIYKTTDGGQNWVPIPLAGYSIPNDKEYTGTDTIIFSGADGTFSYRGSIISSVNTGASFQEHILGSDYSTLGGTHFITGAKGFGVFTSNWPDYKNYLVNTTNGGLSWDTILTDTASTLSLTDVFMNNSTNGYLTAITGTTGSIFKVTGGTKTLDHTTNFPLRRMYKGGNTLFAIGDGGKIVRIGLTMGLAPTTSPLVGLYPNPTSGILNIPVQTRSLVSIIDMGGKTIVEKYIMPGDQFNLPNMANGIYNIRVKNEQGISTAKFLLNK